MSDPYDIPRIECDYSVKTPSGEHLLLNSTAKLEKGCTVAIFQNRRFLFSGTLLRHPVWFRHLVIGYRDVHGNYAITRMFGLMDEDILAWRVAGIGVLTPIDYEHDKEAAQ